MTDFSMDVEADGPAPGLFSMVSLGAVVVEDGLQRTFYCEMRPLEGADWDPNALAISGKSREEHLAMPDASICIPKFAAWVEENSNGRAIFWADNNGFDWQFINYYMWRFNGSNPFGFSSQNINSLWKGINRNVYTSFKHLRKNKHTHHPVDDAKGNAEAMLAMRDDKRMKFGK